MNNIKTVFLDVDGVLADFHLGILELYGLTENEFRQIVPPGKFYWDKHIDEKMMENLSRNFWVNLHKTSDGDEIINLLEEKFGQENICLLSNHVNMPDYAYGKIVWINLHYPRYADQYLLGTSKHYCASPRALLVDDADHNINDFRNHGGKGILVPRYWNSLHNAILPMKDYMKQMLFYI